MQRFSFGSWGLGGNFIENDSNQRGAAGTLTLGPSIIVRGKNGQIYSYYNNGGLLNQGTVNADVVGGTIQLGANAGSVSNAGTIESSNAGTINPARRTSGAHN